MQIRPIVAAVAIAAGSLLPLGVLASTSAGFRPAGRSTQSLVSAVRETGTTVRLRCPDDARYAGFYSSSQRTLAVCVDDQEGQIWSDDDRDTLRHEAVHLVQDCMGGLGDNNLETTATVSRLMHVALNSGLNLEQIEEVYRAGGADDLTILLEWEAFSLAALLNEGEVEAMVRRACLAAVSIGIVAGTL